MKTPRRRPAPGALVLAAVLAGCAHAPPAAPDPAALEQARRDERLKIMQDYWNEQTSAPLETARASGPAPIAYPAGVYSGINFGPRVAPDPSLAEPER